MNRRRNRVKELINILRSDDWRAKEIAAENLNILNWKPFKKTDKAIYLMAQHKWDECAEIGKSAVGPLCDVLGNKNVDVSYRQRAAFALSQIADPEAVNPFCDALKDKDNYLRRRASYALGEIRNPRAIEPLIKALGDEDIVVYWEAKEALIKIGEPVIGPLCEKIRSIIRDSEGQISDVSF